MANLTELMGQTLEHEHPVRNNIFFALLGFIAPNAILFFSYPVVIHGIGTSSFGIFLLANSVTAAFGLLDLGLAAATIRLVAQHLATEERDHVSTTIVTSLVYYGCLGVCCVYAVYLFTDPIVQIFHVERTMVIDAKRAFRLGATQFAVTLLMSVAVAACKGMQRFDIASLLSSSLATLSAILALSTVLLGGGLVALCRAGLVSAVIVTIGAWIVLNRVAARNRVRLIDGSFSLPQFLRMLSFGSVMTLNSISGILLYQVQRYLIALVHGPHAVTIFQSAFIAPSKAHAAISAASEVMFPFASGSGATSGVRRIYGKLMLLSGGLALLTLGSFYCVRVPLVTWWLGRDLAGQVLPLLPHLILAFMFLSMSPAPYHLLNGLGKPHINTAFFALNGVLNVLSIWLLNATHSDLGRFALAFLTANVVTAVAYQCYVELLVWRKMRPQELST